MYPSICTSIIRLARRVGFAKVERCHDHDFVAAVNGSGTSGFWSDGTAYNGTLATKRHLTLLGTIFCLADFLIRGSSEGHCGCAVHGARWRLLFQGAKGPRLVLEHRNGAMTTCVSVYVISTESVYLQASESPIDNNLYMYV